jgi:hypothetical protein
MASAMPTYLASRNRYLRCDGTASKASLVLFRMRIIIFPNVMHQTLREPRSALIPKTFLHAFAIPLA